MNKSILISTVIVGGLLSACSPNIDNVAGKPNTSINNTVGTLMYSNLIDTKSQDEIKELLKENQVEEEDIEMLIQSIQNYYKSIGDTSLFDESETLTSELQLPYAVYELPEVWEKNNPDFFDQNCRITAFRLFNNFIISESEVKKSEMNTKMLEIDLGTIQSNPDSIFNEEEITKFINFFSVIPITDSTNIEKSVEEIQNELKNRKISFVNPDSMSLISGYILDEDSNSLFVGHTGVAIKAAEDIIFIEKYGFGLPYQVTKFKNKEELKSYMIDRMKAGFMGEPQSFEPIIMQNDELM